MKLDHVLIRVANLNQAIMDFKTMGFNTYPGNSKKHCHHAMIYFSDETFIELVDPTKFPYLYRWLAKLGLLSKLGPLFKRFGKYATTNNLFIDYALLADPFEEFYESVTNKSKILTMRRKNHLGQKLTWKLFAFKELELPFVMSEYLPERLPEPFADEHPNGVKGIDILEISATKDFLQTFSKRFDIPLTSDNSFSLKNTQINSVKQNRNSLNSVILKIESKNTTIDKELLKKYGLQIVATTYDH